MAMKKAHQVLLKELERSPQSSEELVENTGYSYDGIRGRLSEMRKLGYDIRYEEKTEIKKIKVKKYVLHNSVKSKEFLDFLDKYQLYGKIINIDKISEKSGISEEEIKSIVSKLFLNPKYSVIQLSNVQIKIQRLS